jgi:hypothetical protein
MRPLVVVDAANVVGSVPDGWWRDRHGAAERLRERLTGLAEAGFPADRTGLPGWAVGAPLEVVLVVEGAARGVASVPGVRVDPAPGSGDDLIVALVERARGRRCLVVTADRGLRARAGARGAEVAGPRAVRPEAGDRPGGGARPRSTHPDGSRTGPS